MDFGSPSRVNWFAYPLPWDRKKASKRSLSSCCRGSALNQSQSTDQFIAVRHASNAKLTVLGFQLAAKGSPSNVEYSGTNPVLGCAAATKKSRLTLAHSFQNGRSASGPQIAQSS